MLLWNSFPSLVKLITTQQKLESNTAYCTSFTIWSFSHSHPATMIRISSSTSTRRTRKEVALFLCSSISKQSLLRLQEHHHRRFFPTTRRNIHASAQRHRLCDGYLFSSRFFLSSSSKMVHSSTRTFTKDMNNKYKANGSNRSISLSSSLASSSPASALKEEQENKPSRLLENKEEGDIVVLKSTSNNNRKNPNYLLNEYQKLVVQNKASHDMHQLLALQQLNQLRNDILDYNSKTLFYTTQKNNVPPSSSSTSTGTSTSTSTLSLSLGDGEEQEALHQKDQQQSSSLFSSFTSTVSSFFDNNQLHPQHHHDHTIKGVYLHGGVGCGKTFCMNLFYDSLPNDISKQKVHFHSFMLNIHQQMHEAKMIHKQKGDEIIPFIIKQTIQQGKIICFDEFQVTDIADAVILRQLFTSLLNHGVIMIATSNRPPQDLYLNGLQRDLFIPFIHLLDEQTHVVSMWDSDVDYRLIQGIHKNRGVYFIGGNHYHHSNNEEKMKFEKVYQTLTKNTPSTSTILTTQGRKVEIPVACINHSICKFKFDVLCREAKGAADYLLIGHHFHTVFVEDVPKLSLNEINLVRRFITFVDAMYECHVTLIIHAETNMNDIFKVDLENQHCDEAFAFDRTRSRLEEMGSDEYLKTNGKKWNEKKKTD